MHNISCLIFGFIFFQRNFRNCFRFNKPLFFPPRLTASFLQFTFSQQHISNRGYWLCKYWHRRIFLVLFLRVKNFLIHRVPLWLVSGHLLLQFCILNYSILVQIWKRSYLKYLMFLLQRLCCWWKCICIYALKEIMSKNIYGLNVLIRFNHYKNDFWYKNKEVRRYWVFLSCSFVQCKITCIGASIYDTWFLIS